VVVDVACHLLAVLVLAADVSERDGAALVLQLYAARYRRFLLLWADSQYGGDLGAELAVMWDMALEVVSKAEGDAGFVTLPRRSVVERSLSWLTRCQPLARVYEPESA
jgi:hypothetical protein